jgi:hypothetical protein
MDSFPSTPGTFTPLPKFGHVLQQGVMPLFTKANEQETPIGTGFMISADGLMMTAAHVVYAAIAAGQRRLSTDRKFYDHYELYALYVTDKEHGTEGHRLGGFLPIQKVWLDEKLDIALCWVERPILEDGPLPFTLCRLSPGLPKEGEHVTGFGYYQMSSQRQEKEVEGKTIIDYEHKTAVTPGEIVKVYPRYRDRGLLNFPCFETNARFDPGMSGGPIWNERGFVCGVICASSDSSHSYGSLLWLALGIVIEVASATGGPVEKITLYDLIQRGFVATDETIKNITVKWGDNGNRDISVKR